ncbi:MAG: sugar phosphate isomerase/epimerase [Clostridia bacterium]|nr:sugar phosphate isomerase/epimerase [Clostridia bacterium]
MSVFTISGFSDEIDKMIDVQFAHIKSLGITHFEPRFVDGTSIADLTDEQVSVLKEKMQKEGIKVSSIGSPIGKIKITDEFEPHLQKLARVIEIAKALDAKYIRIFSFFIEKGDDLEKWHDEVICRMKKMTELAEREGIMLLHENEKNIWGELPEQCDRIIREVNSPCLRAVFDPANFIQAGAKPYPDAYNIMKPHIEYMHIKDALEDGSVVPAGYGIGQIDKILGDLKNSGWTGYVSLEPHLGAFEGLGSLEGGEDKTVMKSGATPEKFTLAYESLVKIINSL